MTNNLANPEGTSADSTSVSAHQAGRTPRGCTIAATIWAISLGLWLAGVAMSFSVAAKVTEERNGFSEVFASLQASDGSTFSERKEKAEGNFAIFIHATEASVIVFPILFFWLGRRQSKSATDVFVNLRWVFALFVVCYLMLWQVWTSGALQWEQEKSPIDVRYDQLMPRLWLFIFLFGFTFFLASKNKQKRTQTVESN